MSWAGECGETTHTDRQTHTQTHTHTQTDTHTHTHTLADKQFVAVSRLYSEHAVDVSRPSRFLCTLVRASLCAHKESV